MGRVILLPAVNNPETVDALIWLIDNIHRRGDSVHILNIVPYVNIILQHGKPCSTFPRYAQAAYSGVMLPPSADDVDQKVKMTEGALRHRLGAICDETQVRVQCTLLTRAPPTCQQIAYTLEVVKAAGDAESIGEFICSRAVELDASLVVMGAHEKGAAVRFFIGSVTSHCVKHCARYDAYAVYGDCCCVLTTPCRPVVVYHGSERTVARVPSLALMASSPVETH